MNRNITFSLPAELIKKAKIYAAEHDTTVNAVIREILEEKVTGESVARAAAREMLERARKDPPLFQGNPGSIRREDLYDRR